MYLQWDSDKKPSFDRWCQKMGLIEAPPQTPEELKKEQIRMALEKAERIAAADLKAQGKHGDNI